MGFVDVKWGGFAKIIVDTATMQVGDKVRVKSMTTGTTYDKTVATVGTPLVWETEIYKDYVKICMVQTINDTPTEIGGVYKTVDYGQTLFINVLDKTTLGGIQGILNAHQETSLLQIGDEVDITVNGTLETFVLAHLNAYASHSAIFCKKQATGSLTNSTTKYSTGGQKAWCESYYNTIDSRDKQFIKQKTVTAGYSTSAAEATTDNYVWTPTMFEVIGSNTSISPESSSNNTQFDLFTTANGRQRNASWFTATHWGNGTYNIYYGLDSTGSGIQAVTVSMLPCFMLTADS